MRPCLCIVYCLIVSNDNIVQNHVRRQQTCYMLFQGISSMLWRAAKAFNDDSFMQSAIRAQDCIWNRGILSKGLMQCHGITGNTYMMLDMYQGTKNNTYLYRALQFQEFVLENPLLHDPDHMRITDPPAEMYQHWVGSYPSAVVLWADFLSNPATASMTGYSAKF